MSNCCGLSTFLMLIIPEKNLMFKKFLNELYSKISFLLKKERNEFKWSIALDYILLKTAGKNILSEFLNEQIPDFLNYITIMIYLLENESFRVSHRKSQDFFEKNLVNSYILRRSLFSMRKNVDLNIFFSLFGGGFYPQEQEIYDGTGSLYFTRNDFNLSSPIFDAKIQILKDHLLSSENESIKCIALNKGFHWVAISSIEGRRLLINNPLSSRINQLIVNNNINDSYRFYLYDYNPNNAIILKEEALDFFNSEIEKEKLIC